ncbi:MAG: 2-phospho-L-lactate transferase CofD family protein, partial [Thermoleophilia bacterium]
MNALTRAAAANPGSRDGNEGSPPRRRHRWCQARGRDAGGDRLRPRGGRQHRRRHRGARVHVSPDPDLVTYWLSGEIDEERGWGLRDDSFTVFERLTKLGAPSWFGLSDRDLAACLYRRQFVEEGGSFSAAQAQIARSLGVEARVLPMCETPVRTKVHTAAGTRGLQEYLIVDSGQPEVHGVELDGIA